LDLSDAAGSGRPDRADGAERVAATVTPVDPGTVPTGGDRPSSDPDATLHEAVASLLSEHAPVIISLIGPDETVLALDGVLVDQIGYRRSDWVGSRVPDLVQNETVLEVIRRSLAGETATGTTLMNGRTWSVAARPVPSEEGGQNAAVCVLTFADAGIVHRELSATAALNEQFAALIQLSQDFIAIADLDGNVTFVNHAGRRLVGLEDDAEVLGRQTQDYFTESGRAKSQEIEDSVRTRGYWEGETSLRHFGTGEEIPVSANSFLVTRSSDGTPLALATVQRDLRSRMRQEAATLVRAQEQRAIAELGRQALTTSLTELMSEAVQLIHVRYPSLVAGVLQRSADGRTTELVASSVPEWTPIVLELDDDSLTGRAMVRNELVYTDDVVADPAFPHDAPTSRYGMRTALCCPIPGGEHPWGTVGASGAEPRHWTEDDIAFVESVAATLGAAVRRQELEDQLQHQALHDPLTGLPNRALVMDRIDNALGRSARRSSMLAVLLLDLDDFKTVNDSMGHGTGDDLLSELALRLAGVVRDGDTVARLGGDEFVVVCEEVESEQDVAFVAEALLEQCATVVELGDRRISLSASVGVALAVAGETSTAGLLSEADIAMYRAKRDRPGTYRIFDEAMRGDVLGRINIAGELRAAVRRGALDIDYQPIVDLVTGEVVALEALARWTNDAGERVPPDVFIPVAEETGLIGELGAVVLRGAVRRAVSWQSIREVGVRVNASAHELRSRSYLDQVLSTLDEEGLDPRLLGLEVTESILVDDDKTTQDTLYRLRDAGISLLIDDFGTGYSSLSYLQRFPVVDVLKVDRSFLGEGTRGEAVVQAVVGLGRAFGLQVCAEGVETPEQHARVTELGCDFAQGYLLARPVPGDQTESLIADWVPRANHTDI
jgi:diguanylate cyclase (GGDEF)-like protein/PAS domain S-box-containing protein